MTKKEGNPLPEYVVCQNCGCLLTERNYTALSQAITAIKDYPETGAGFSLSVDAAPPSGGWAPDPEFLDEWD